MKQPPFSSLRSEEALSFHDLSKKEEKKNSTSLVSEETLDSLDEIPRENNNGPNLDTLVDEVVKWIDNNHAFFSAALNGNLQKWINSKSKDSNFHEINQQLSVFKKKLIAEFNKENTVDAREVKYSDDQIANAKANPWTCFSNSILASKDEYVRNSLIPSNIDNELLKLFLEKNFHITACLFTELSELNDIVQIWEEHQFGEVVKNVLNWINKTGHMEFLKTLLEKDELQDFIKTKLKNFKSDFNKIKQGEFIPEHIKNMDDLKTRKEVVLGYKTYQGTTLQNKEKYFVWLDRMVEKFNEELDDAFENSDTEPFKGPQYFLVNKNEKQLSEFLSENKLITKYLAKNLSMFDSAAEIWHKHQVEQQIENSSQKMEIEKKDVSMAELAAQSMSGLLQIQTTTKLDTPPQPKNLKRKEPEPTEETKENTEPAFNRIKTST